MRRTTPLRPRSRREVHALTCLAQLVWIGVLLAWAGHAEAPPDALLLPGLGVAALIAVVGLLVARRFRR